MRDDLKFWKSVDKVNYCGASSPVGPTFRADR
jgi:hypothetical protein